MQIRWLVTSHWWHKVVLNNKIYKKWTQEIWNSLSQRTLWWREEFLLFVRYVELASSCFWKQWRRGYTLQRFSIFHELAHFLPERIIEKENLETSPVFHARSSLQFWTLQFSGTPVAPRVFPCKICAWTPCAQRPLFVGAFSRLHNSRFINNSSLGSNDPNRLHTRIQCRALRPCYMMYSGQTLAIFQTMWV